MKAWNGNAILYWLLIPMKAKIHALVEARPGKAFKGLLRRYFETYEALIFLGISGNRSAWGGSFFSCIFSFCCTVRLRETVKSPQSPQKLYFQNVVPFCTVMMPLSGTQNNGIFNTAYSGASTHIDIFASALRTFLRFVGCCFPLVPTAIASVRITYVPIKIRAACHFIQKFVIEGLNVFPLLFFVHEIFLLFIACHGHYTKRQKPFQEP